MDVIFLKIKLRCLAVVLAFILAVGLSNQCCCKRNEHVFADTIQADMQEDMEQTQTTPKELSQLYAQSACLLDGDSGRVLYEKNGYDPKPNASTTKILTCIVTLENGNLDDIVTISKNAAKQPDVQLNAQSGEEFKLENLLYSLMLESHNDSAVAIAEHIGGSVEAFAAMMNQKAMDIGCTQSHFVTPNGLDGSDSQGQHATTATDLAKIMRYCIKESPKAQEFLDITRTSSVSFSNVAGSRSFSCVNHNAFLSMMEGALSGKTGFTSEAGYCYVGSLRRDGKTFIVALLACGWPNHKTYKWSDTKKLMEYGLKYYNYQDVLDKTKTFSPIPVLDGIPMSEQLSDDAVVNVSIDFGTDETFPVLLKEGEQVETVYQVPGQMKAPVEAGETVGKVMYKFGDDILKEYEIHTIEAVDKITYKWCLEKIWNSYLCGE